MPAPALAAARAAVAATALGIFVLAFGQGVRLDRVVVRHMIVLGTVNGWLPNVMTGMALGRIASAQGALIQAFGPLMVAALAAATLRDEPLTSRRVLGLLVGLIGIAIIFAPLVENGATSITGGLLMVATTACYAVGTVYARWARPDASAAIVLGQQVFAMIPALLLTLATGPAQAFDQPLPVWLAVAALGIFGSAVPGTLYLRLLRTARASDAALVGYLQPAFASVLAGMMLREWPEPRALLGGAIVLASVRVATAPR